MVIVEIKYKIVEYGLIVEDFGFGVKGVVVLKKVGCKVLVCYCDNNGNIWMGCGKCLGWLVKELLLGWKMEDFLVV